MRAVISCPLCTPQLYCSLHLIPFAISVLGLLAVKSAERQDWELGRESSMEIGEQHMASPGCKGCADHHSLGSEILEAFSNLSDSGIPRFPMAQWPHAPHASRDAPGPQNAAGPEVTWGKSHLHPLIPLLFSFGSSQSLQ